MPGLPLTWIAACAGVPLPGEAEVRGGGGVHPTTTETPTDPDSSETYAEPGLPVAVFDSDTYALTRGRLFADLDGDGAGEVGVLAWQDDHPEWWLFSSASRGTPAPEDRLVRVAGWGQVTAFTTAPEIATGDLDADGATDLVVLTDAGASWARGPLPSEIDVRTLPQVVDRPLDSRYDGYVLARQFEGIGVVDWDHDGALDVWLERYSGGYYFETTLFVFGPPFYPPAGEPRLVLTSLARSEVVSTGPSWFCQTPKTPVEAGDVDDDGVGDWLVGRSSCEPALVSGMATGAVESGEDALMQLSNLGTPGPAGDSDLDGLPEIWVQNGELALERLEMPVPGTATATLTVDSWRDLPTGFPHVLADLDGDGGPEVALGLPHDDRVLVLPSSLEGDVAVVDAPVLWSLRGTLGEAAAMGSVVLLSADADPPVESHDGYGAEWLLFDLR